MKSLVEKRRNRRDRNDRNVFSAYWRKICCCKIYMNKKYMTSISKNAYIDKLDDIVNKYNNTYHNTIKMKPIDVKSIRL